MMFPFGKTGHKPLSKKSFLGFLTAEEILAQIEEDETVTSAMVFIQPPSDSFDSEEDSGDEDTGDSVIISVENGYRLMLRRELFQYLGLGKETKGIAKLVVSLISVPTALNFL